ncbi:hypothetical protein ACFORG_18425 [Lutimaribacter marinistellae]|uniref:Uncharacterized protein n=1 Tax=Lutimaribacter marinistellae TaxID=1820329 RepID=A0ABV7TKA0_9RHOB
MSGRGEGVVVTHRAGGSNLLLAGSTMVAAIFVAVQAWYARVAFVEASETRLLEKKLDICFENFDAAAKLDAALRGVTTDAMLEEQWPPQIVLEDAGTLRALQGTVVPRLNSLESGLAKASILGALDKHRAYLAQQLQGLSKRLLDVVPARSGQTEMDSEIGAVMSTLSEFLGAQYSVFAGCRLVAEGKA